MLCISIRLLFKTNSSSWAWFLSPLALNCDIKKICFATKLLLLLLDNFLSSKLDITLLERVISRFIRDLGHLRNLSLFYIRNNCFSSRRFNIIYGCKFVFEQGVDYSNSDQYDVLVYGGLNIFI